MTYFAKLWYHVSTCLYVCVRCGLILKDFKLFQAAHAGHIRPGTLNWMQKTTTANIRHTITVFDAFDGLKFATWCPKLVPLTMKVPIRPYQLMDTGYCTYWHLSSSDGVSVPLTWGLTGWPCYVFTLFFCFSVFFRPIQATRCSAMHTTPETAQPGAFLRVEFYWLGDVSALGTLWLWTSSILTLATCFMYREASVLGLESWREKQRGALMSMLHPCWTPACHYPSAWQAEAVSNYGYMRRQKGEANSALVKVPLSLTFPCLTVCWSWHFPRQQEQTSCRWLLIAITGGASWVRALAGNLDVAMDG